MNNIDAIKTTTYVNSKDICLAVYHWGEIDHERETIVLIHGYPDSAEVWEAIAQFLKDDFNVVAYDVRGTGLSDIPVDKKEYAFSYLVEDLSSVINSVSPNKAVHLVGHDWGALQAWEAVLDDQLKIQIKSYTAMTPSIDHVGWWFKRQWKSGTLQGYRNVIQRLAGSSYMAMLQIPVLPELTWFAGLSYIWPKLVGKMEKVTVQANAKQLRNSTSGLGLYRQNLQKGLLHPSTRKTTIPVNMLMMSKDPFVPAYLCEGMQEWASDLTYSEVKAGHWGILSQPNKIAKNIKQYVEQQSK